MARASTHRVWGFGWLGWVALAILLSLAIPTAMGVDLRFALMRFAVAVVPIDVFMQGLAEYSIVVMNATWVPMLNGYVLMGVLLAWWRVPYRLGWMRVLPAVVLGVGFLPVVYAVQQFWESGAMGLWPGMMGRYWMITGCVSISLGVIALGALGNLMRRWAPMALIASVMVMLLLLNFGFTTWFESLPEWSYDVYLWSWRIGAVVALLWWSQIERRWFAATHTSGACPICGYLAGDLSVCPECGKAAEISPA